MRTRIACVVVVVAFGCAGFAERATAQALAVKAGLNYTNLFQDATLSPADRQTRSIGFMVGAEIRRGVTEWLALHVEGLVTVKGNSLRNVADLAQNITVWVNELVDGPSGASFTMQLIDAIGPAATAANVLYSTTVALPNIESPAAHLPVLMTDINTLLNAGSTY